MGEPSTVYAKPARLVAACEPSPTVALKSISRSQTSLMAALGNIKQRFLRSAGAAIGRRTYTVHTREGSPWTASAYQSEGLRAVVRGGQR